MTKNIYNSENFKDQRLEIYTILIITLYKYDKYIKRFYIYLYTLCYMYILFYIEGVK